MSRRVATVSLFAFLLSLLSPAARSAELVMFESRLCDWCRVWHTEIGPVYPKTREGRMAPLRRVEVDAPRPADLAFIRGVRWTPTFVLIEGGQEIGRITGYAGEDFFWGQLEELLRRLDAPQPQSISG